MHLRLLLVAAIFLPSCFTAHAETFTFTASGSGFSASGTLTGTQDSSNPAAFDIQSGTALINGLAATLFTPSGTSTSFQSVAFADSGPDADYDYDNVVYTSGPALDFYGLLFTQGTNHINLFYDAGYANTNDFTPDSSPNSFSLATTPEPSSLLLLMTGVGGLAGTMRKRFAAV